jgi:hypothetical protein
VDGDIDVTSTLIWIARRCRSTRGFRRSRLKAGHRPTTDVAIDRSTILASGKRRTRSTMKSLIPGVGGAFRRLQYPLDMLFICERCRAVAPCLCHREEVTGEPSMVVDRSTAHYWWIKLRPSPENALRLDKPQSATTGGRTRPTTRSRAIGTTCTVQLITREARMNSLFLLGGLNSPPGATPRSARIRIASVILDRIDINLAALRENNIQREPLAPIEYIRYPNDIAKNHPIYPPTGPPDDRSFHSVRRVIQEIRNMHIILVCIEVMLTIAESYMKDAKIPKYSASTNFMSMHSLPFC